MNIFTIFSLVVFIYSVVIHEVSHGLAAQSLGDDTAKNLGRLSLNPLKHIDMFGSVILPIFLLFISKGGFAFGYAKPVPYNPNNLRDRKYGPIKVAMAGPASNILIALIFGLMLRFFSNQLGPNVSDLFSNIVFINLILAVFNLIPIPPLDGHWVLVTLLPARFDAFRMFIYRYGIFLFIFFLLFIYPIIFPVIPWLAQLIIGS
jgi:Zn-dependent protease